MTAIAWGLIVLGAGLFVVGMLRRWADKDLRHWERGTLTFSQTRAIDAAVYSGTPPEDEELQAPARDLAATALHNYPIILGAIKLSFPGFFIAALGVAGLVPEAAGPLLLTFLVLAPYQVIRLNRQRQGAERLLSR